jgi:hypothetical protein
VLFAFADNMLTILPKTGNTHLSKGARNKISLTVFATLIGKA